jgi:hypothetical protein
MGRTVARPALRQARVRDVSGLRRRSKRSWKTAYLALPESVSIGYNIRIGEFLVMIIRREGRYGRTGSCRRAFSQR